MVPLVLRLLLFRFTCPHASADTRPIFQLSRPAFFCCSFSWALLRANSCARQLRGFCFSGSSRTAQVPPIKHPLALGAAASRFCVPQENGARKRRKIHVLPDS